MNCFDGGIVLVCGRQSPQLMVSMALSWLVMVIMARVRKVGLRGWVSWGEVKRTVQMPVGFSAT